jgi:glycosyltransferase involved in cell wall biosynthesis
VEEKVQDVKRIIAISFTDVGLSWGPAVHFLEVWNRIHASGKFLVEAYACCDANKPYIESPCIRMLAKSGNTAVGRFVSKVALDLFLFFRLLMTPRTMVYMRWSQYCIFSAVSCRVRGHTVFFEMNGLAREDCTSAGSSIFRRIHFHISEFVCLRNRKARIIAVSRAIEESMGSRYKVTGTVTIPNGCKPSLNAIRRLPRTHGREFTLAYVGTFTPWDGHMLLPRVARIYGELGIPFLISIAGLRLERSAIYKDVSTMDCFRYEGNVEYMRLDEFYSKADAGIALYEFERHKTVELSSLKLLEYFAFGLPIITTAVPGTEFVDRHGVGMRLGKEDVDNDESFRARIVEFYYRRGEFAEAYQKAPPARTWDDVALEITEYVNGCCR